MFLSPVQYFRYGMAVEDVAELEEGPSGEIQPKCCANVSLEHLLRENLEVQKQECHSDKRCYRPIEDLSEPYHLRQSQSHHAMLESGYALAFWMRISLSNGTVQISRPNPAGPTRSCTVFIGIAHIPAPNAQASCQQKCSYIDASKVRNRTANTASEPVVVATIVVTYVLPRTGQLHIKEVAFCAITISLMLHSTYTQFRTASPRGRDSQMQKRSVAEHDDWFWRLDSRQ
jgi:hypothetical protein